MQTVAGEEANLIELLQLGFIHDAEFALRLAELRGERAAPPSTHAAERGDDDDDDDAHVELEDDDGGDAPLPPSAAASPHSDASEPTELPAPAAGEPTEGKSRGERRRALMAAKDVRKRARAAERQRKQREHRAARRSAAAAAASRVVCIEQCAVPAPAPARAPAPAPVRRAAQCGPSATITTLSAALQLDDVAPTAAADERERDAWSTMIAGVLGVPLDTLAATLALLDARAAARVGARVAEEAYEAAHAVDAEARAARRHELGNATLRVMARVHRRAADPRSLERNFVRVRRLPRLVRAKPQRWFARDRALRDKQF